MQPDPEPGTDLQAPGTRGQANAVQKDLQIYYICSVGLLPLVVVLIAWIVGSSAAGYWMMTAPLAYTELRFLCGSPGHIQAFKSLRTMYVICTVARAVTTAIAISRGAATLAVFRTCASSAIAVAIRDTIKFALPIWFMLVFVFLLHTPIRFLLAILQFVMWPTYCFLDITESLLCPPMDELWKAIRRCLSVSDTSLLIQIAADGLKGDDAKEFKYMVYGAIFCVDVFCCFVTLVTHLQSM
ncbi:unnamed protein product [Vitrella brassicaformis CCMP3155]|uniref:Uncharacterized protein n=1 Tax=Vitrella brassicaformis (strain CCMP3155) TaxID=1169540 RepID=A0A0G4GHC3_VITBC|nr:unnamed protein product [Vitrella brassicaformis CCMP3155]|eukprot:CEM29137.1 unnamed protein product [Vitrella brassicaformis CCMP3155]